MMLIDIVIELIVHAFNYMVSYCISIIWHNLMHTFLDIHNKIPSDYCNDIFLVIYGKDLDYIFLKGFNQLNDLSVIRESEVNRLEKLSILIQFEKLFILFQNAQIKLFSIFLGLNIFIRSYSSKLEIITAIDDNQIFKITF